MDSPQVLVGAVEAGGTKFVCAVGTGPDDVRAQERFDTTLPVETIAKCLAFLQRFDGLAAVGIAAFGPLDLQPASATYGCITSTPKTGWQNISLAGAFSRALGLPVGIDTDVNGAALGEWRWGAAQDLDNFLYLTIGTGIGGGAFVNGRVVHGLLHPEMGHIRVPHDFAADPFAGSCPFHGDCLEGLATGVAMEKRWGQKAETLPVGHPAWELEAHYLALALANYVCVLSPQRIIMGGGVMSQPQLLPLVRRKLVSLLGGYVQAAEILEHTDRYVVAPALGSRAGVLGALALAQAVLDS